MKNVISNFRKFITGIKNRMKTNGSKYIIAIALAFIFVVTLTSEFVNIKSVEYEVVENQSLVDPLMRKIVEGYSVIDEDSEMVIYSVVENDMVMLVGNATDILNTTDSETVYAEEVQAETEAETVVETEVSTEAETEQVAVEAVISYSEEDYNNLVRIVEAEATGLDIKAKILVANVIINRVQYGYFPNTVTQVIYQGNGEQFAPIADGRFYSVAITDSSIEAVNRALLGEDYSEGAYYFTTVASVNAGCWHTTHLKRLFEYNGHVFFTFY